MWVQLWNEINSTDIRQRASDSLYFCMVVSRFGRNEVKRGNLCSFSSRASLTACKLPPSKKKAEWWGESYSWHAPHCRHDEFVWWVLQPARSPQPRRSPSGGAGLTAPAWKHISKSSTKLGFGCVNELGDQVFIVSIHGNGAMKSMKWNLSLTLHWPANGEHSQAKWNSKEMKSEFYLHWPAKGEHSQARWNSKAGEGCFYLVFFKCRSKLETPEKTPKCSESNDPNVRLRGESGLAGRLRLARLPPGPGQPSTCHCATCEGSRAKADGADFKTGHRQKAQARPS